MRRKDNDSGGSGIPASCLGCVDISEDLIIADQSNVVP